MNRGVPGSAARRHVVLALALPYLAVSCEVQPAGVPSPPFDEVFALAEVVVLGEDPADSIAEVGPFFEKRDGGFVIADRLLPRVRTYSQDGTLEAGFGRFGEGPWEFRRIRSVTETADGRIVVTGAPNGALTYLNADLTPHSMVLLDDYVPGTVLPLGNDLLIGGVGRDMDLYEIAAQDGLYHRLVDSTVVWSNWNTRVASVPYWHALGSLHATVGGDSVYVMAGLLYPATVLNGAGDSVGTIGTPPAGFRRVPEIEAGAFAYTAEEGPAAQAGNPIQRLIESFELVTNMDVVGDYLVFTVGKLDENRPWYPFRQIEVLVEAYNRHTGEKLFENVPLPGGSKVLGGGRYLYVLLNPDIPPWRIARYEVLPDR